MQLFLFVFFLSSYKNIVILNIGYCFQTALITLKLFLKKLDGNVELFRAGYFFQKLVKSNLKQIVDLLCPAFSTKFSISLNLFSICSTLLHIQWLFCFKSWLFPHNDWLLLLLLQGQLRQLCQALVLPLFIRTYKSIISQFGFWQQKSKDMLKKH